MILAGDIGGTNTRVALFCGDDRREPVALAVYRSGELSGLEDALRSFLAEHPAELRGAAFGVAGPVRDNRSAPVNLAWEVDAEQVATVLGLPFVTLLNDLDANARGLAALGDDDFAVLCPGAADGDGNAVVLSAGTGLGLALLIRDGAGFRAVAGEGGHVDFAPTSELELRLWRFLERRFRHVSYERILSGQGLENLYDFLVSDGYGAPLAAPRDAATIARCGLEGESETCAKVLDLFASIYGAAAGNVALTVMATGGVYLGGGIAPKLLAKFADGTFLRAFRAKGRFAPVLDAIPVRVVLNDRAALIGAALAAEGGLR